MSKAGQKLIKALTEATEAIKCDHVWKYNTQGKPGPLQKTCKKCGLRMYHMRPRQVVR